MQEKLYFGHWLYIAKLILMLCDNDEINMEPNKMRCIYLCLSIEEETLLHYPGYSRLQFLVES
jgi:DNA-binding winged helix-turn-helix (wHTH) protein